MTRCEYYIKRDGNLDKAYEDYMKTIVGHASSTRRYNNWLMKEYVEKPKPILDKVEHKYLESFLKPFRNKIAGIVKYPSPILTNRNRTHLVIKFFNGDATLYLPYFDAKTMYLGIENNKTYSYEDLIEKNHL